MNTRKTRLGYENAGNFRGHLKVLVKDINGRVVDIKEDDNLIVTTARQQMAHIIADGSDQRIISTIKLGDDATPSDVSQTDIQGNLVWSGSTSYSYPSGDSSTQVMFTATTPYDEGNGTGSSTINEATLHCANGELFARRVFGPITKTIDFSLTFEWTIVY